MYVIDAHGPVKNCFVGQVLYDGLIYLLREPKGKHKTYKKVE